MGGACALTAPGPTAGAVRRRDAVGAGRVTFFSLSPEKKGVMDHGCWAPRRADLIRRVCRL